MTMDDDLQLTKEQREQIMEIRSNLQKQMIDLQADQKKLHLDLHEQLRKDKPNRKTIDATLAAINNKQGAIKKLHVDQHLQVREILTPEQRDKFDSRPIKSGRFDKGRGKRGRRHHPGGKMQRW
jgi:Spy/CpxP family protein refolding chaperone